MKDTCPIQIEDRLQRDDQCCSFVSEKRKIFCPHYNETITAEECRRMQQGPVVTILPPGERWGRYVCVRGGLWWYCSVVCRGAEVRDINEYKAEVLKMAGEAKELVLEKLAERGSLGFV